MIAATNICRAMREDCRQYRPPKMIWELAGRSQNSRMPRRPESPAARGPGGCRTGKTIADSVRLMASGTVHDPADRPNQQTARRIGDYSERSSGNVA
jgi:hypothetical protein